ncbi:MAG: hypothetical protein H7Z21_07730 [Hymenobacter sp.]|nr:hypothetical protein [Hymenobacter sp.]
MKTLLFSAFLVAASVSSSFAQNQTSAAADSWLDTPAAATTPEEVPRYNTGRNTAPGQSLSLHGKPTTDYWGRPFKSKAKNLTTAAKETAYAEAESTDPMMHSSGVMIAPGMNSAPYRRVSTDYWGRPLKKAVKSSSAVASSGQKTPPATAHTTTGW